jgi:NAD(P)-dependent dehydrogenase (short-subunit alcohol dehydrogenase family)
MEFAGNVAFITGGGGVGRANAIGFAGRRQGRLAVMAATSSEKIISRHPPYASWWINLKKTILVVPGLSATSRNRWAKSLTDDHGI